MKRWKRILIKLLFAFACFVTLLFLLYQFENWRGWRTWKNYKTKVERDGGSLNPASVIPPPIPDASNFAAVPLFQHMSATNGPYTGSGPGTPAATKQILDDFSSLYGRAEEQPINASNSFVARAVDLRALAAAFQGRTIEVPAPETENDLTSEEEVIEHYGLESAPVRKLLVDTNMPLAEAGRVVLEGLQQYEPIFVQLEEAAQRPLSRYLIDYEVTPPFAIAVPHLRYLRSVSLLVKTRGTARLATGQGDLAFHDLQLMLRLADSLQGEPTLVSYLVRVALLGQSLEFMAHGIASQSWSEPQLASLQTDLLKLNLVQDYAQALNAEFVFFGLGSLEYLRRNPSGGWADQMGLDDIYLVFSKVIPGGWFYHEMVNYHRLAVGMYDALDPGKKTIDPESTRRTADNLTFLGEDQAITLLLNHQFWSRMLLPALNRATMRIARIQAGVSLGALACAIERYRLAHQEYPENLEALAPLLNQPVHDVIQGKPLHYRTEAPAGYAAWSVAWDGTNNNGVVAIRGDNQKEPMNIDWAWRPLEGTKGPGD